MDGACDPPQWYGVEGVDEVQSTHRCRRGKARLVDEWRCKRSWAIKGVRSWAIKGVSPISEDLAKRSGKIGRATKLAVGGASDAGIQRKVRRA